MGKQYVVHSFQAANGSPMIRIQSTGAQDAEYLLDPSMILLKWERRPVSFICIGDTDPVVEKTIETMIATTFVGSSIPWIRRSPPLFQVSPRFASEPSTHSPNNSN
jgi:hypothetical protein